MRLRNTFFSVALFAFGLALPVEAQEAEITDPLLAPIEKKGLMVEIRDVVRLPRSLGLIPADQDAFSGGWARPSFVIDLPDGRRFANDQRGFLYQLHGEAEPTVYADFASAFPLTIYTVGQSGLAGFGFHPEFAENGLLYTVHGERASGSSRAPDFIPPGYSSADVTHHNIVTEWRAVDPSANTFQGTRRELLRVARVTEFMRHPLGYVGFNPTSAPGDPDYGLLYINGTDLGFSNGGGPNAENPGQTQRLDSIVTAILRIDPRSTSESNGVKGLGDYTIPAINMFAHDGDPDTLGEIYAYGFRNSHRLSWDLTDGTMFAMDIGGGHIEEINIVHEGGNYGWMHREGLWELGIIRPGGTRAQLYELPEDVLDGRTEDEFTYPVAMYDHDEGQAISAGFAYYGRIQALHGKFIFGDIVRGRLFAADIAAMKAADDGVPRTVAPVEEIQLYTRNSSGNRVYVSFRELIERTNKATTTRADLQLSQSSDGEILVTSRQDGMIRMLVPDESE